MRTRLMSAALAASALLLLAGCAGGTTTEPAPAASADAPSEGAVSGECSYPASGQPAVDVTPPAEGTDQPTGEVQAVLQTSAGDIPLTLDGERTPCTVESFVSLAQQQYFSNTECHRLTTSGIFVLQCGDPTGTGRGGPGYVFANEVDGSETYPAGTVAMANTGRPVSNGSQFFLVYADSTLPPNYTVFGTMSPEGLAVVQSIAAAGTAGGASDGSPANPVTISGVTVG
ncbi:peptidylprolyl isomerase [Microbacterium sp. VKM Ac-2923]|uniref:peptidylprolyl isomerase n=1 Tax=Microbacterium sp. VKM Ac-2923 TaxID=2929476 RepID=UPI001FB2863D|nr:peptidylprolyl isomerase [Microbacterium sp. VKM Ac-2923]MCJ1709056.1 peptidylprolyl isomerase [Microbacterium sp. VKM Ac-2923]